MIGTPAKLIQEIDKYQDQIRSLDFQGVELDSNDMLQVFQRRNSFGLDPRIKIHRIFQTDYFENDLRGGFLTLPQAISSNWNDSLENPLADIHIKEKNTKADIHLGSVVNSMYGSCWTRKEKPDSLDWNSFSHGKPAVRISTTVGKLMDRIMTLSDEAYMHRGWLIHVEYMDHTLIKSMKDPQQIYNRLESQGALLALSAAIVRSSHSDEEEIRLLIDDSIIPQNSSFQRITDGKRKLLRLPFNWDGFVDKQEYKP